MFVRIVSATSAYQSESEMTLDDIIVFCGRVSNPKTQALGLNNHKLIQYLIKHKHWSPFEMGNVCLEVHTTRDIARQILRHRSFSFQEFSQRYAEVETFANNRETRLQDQKNRQNSLVNDDKLLDTKWRVMQEMVKETVTTAYTWAIDNGIAKEVARAVLPEGLTPTTLYINGTVRSWIHYLQVRLDPSTQKEHREVAQACLNELKVVCPIVFKSVFCDCEKKSCIQ